MTEFSPAELNPADPNPAEPAPAELIRRTKSEWRDRLAGARRVRSADDRSAARTANAEHLLAYLTGHRTVCAFLPLSSEPLAPSLLDRLVEVGVRVLVPVVSGGAPLDWTRYPAMTVPGSFGIAEPIGPRLGPTAVTSADAIILPAYAVDVRGVRMGRGGGHYDRTLALLDGVDIEVMAVLFDDERVAVLPREGHDRPVSAVVTPTGGVVRIGAPGAP